jgi:hypothetical protein
MVELFQSINHLHIKPIWTSLQIVIYSVNQGVDTCASTRLSEHMSIMYKFLKVFDHASFSYYHTLLYPAISYIHYIQARKKLKI